MKKYLFLIFCLQIFCSYNSQALSFVDNAHSVIVLQGQVDQLYVRDIVNMNAKQFSLATGHQLNFFQKVYFKVLKTKLRTAVKKNPDLLLNNYYEPKKGKFKLDSLWFIIGAIIGPLGILFAFTSKQPKDKRISAVLGTIVFVLWFGFLFIF
ncbi:MAG: hypothetical protein ABI168_00755 [Ginsengibacter sp.]